MHTPPGFNYEEQWAKTTYVEEMKKTLACDIMSYVAKTDLVPDNLIFMQTQLADGPAEKITLKKKRTVASKRASALAVPQLVFSTEVENMEDLKAGGDASSEATASEERRNSSWRYSETRGPILRIRSQFSELVMTFPRNGTDYPHFIGNGAKSFLSADGDPSTDNHNQFDGDHHFSITTKCKETKYILLKNEGTTAIRYQWFRSGATFDAQQMLGDISEHKNLRLETDEDRLALPPEKDDDAGTTHSEANPLQRLTNPINQEFQFCSLPGVILPGQSVEFPIIFRSKKTGKFYETLHLLTHPRLVTKNGGKNYAVRLTGSCTDISLDDPNNEQFEIKSLRRLLSTQSLEQEATDLMNALVDKAIWELNHPVLPPSPILKG